jgi:hypothetical protein
VSANVAGGDRWAVDPEALVLFTIGTGRWDPRLFDEMLDWFALNHGPLSMQRLRNLTSRFPLAADLVAAVIAWTREPVPAQLLKDQPTPASKQPVFSPDVLGSVAAADPTFEEYGYLRPRVTRSGKSRGARRDGARGPRVPAPAPVRPRKPVGGDARATHLGTGTTGCRPDRR